MKILGIETSCDETGAAVIEGDSKTKTVKILSNVVTSSLAFHSKTGGIIPEIAAREQVKYIIPVVKQALKESGLYLPRPTSPADEFAGGRASSKIKLQSSALYRPDVDAIAVTIGPGLIGSLLVGVETAKTLSFVWKKPIIPVNHLIGHIYANFVSVMSNGKCQMANVKFPAIVLVVSGGHTDLVLMKKHGSILWLGGTRDDAAGEAFDKIGRLLNIPYPAGPTIEKLAKNGNLKAFNFPRPMMDSNDFDFSFSGLKTAVFREVKRLGPTMNYEPLTISNLCASVQQAIFDVLVAKTLNAAQKYQVKSILLSGGVAANSKLREQFELKIPLSAPPKNLCTDNGAMIAIAAFFNYNPVSWKKITANPGLYFD